MVGAAKIGLIGIIRRASVTFDWLDFVRFQH